MSSRHERMTRLEKKAAVVAGTRVVVPGRLAGWWRRYLDRTLDTAQAVTLAEAVLAQTEGDGVTPEQDQAAQAVWSLLWERAAGAPGDQANMMAAFGAPGHWTQILDPVGEGGAK